jgi:hypothetical protein
MSTNTKLTKDDTLASRDGFQITKSGQQEYLINFRNGLWTSIRQKENGIWQFISFYAAAIVLVVGFIQNENFVAELDITRMAVLSTAITLVSFWGVIIILDANFWASRNLWIISNIEWKFLGKKGIGTILPAYYATPDFHYTRLYSLHIYFLFLLMVFSLGGNLALLINPIAGFSFQEDLAIGLMGILVIIFIYYSYTRDKSWVKDYYSDRALAIGDRSNFVNYANYHQLKNAWESPIPIWVLGLSTLLLIILLSSLAISLGTQIDKSSYGMMFLAITALMGIALLIQRTTAQKYIKECQSYIHNSISEVV